MLPTEATARKAVPLYRGLIKYFPRALAAVAELSLAGNEQHNPGSELHWDRAKSRDELDAAARHLFEAGTTDTDNQRHSTKLAWRALANLEKELETAAGLNSVADDWQVPVVIRERDDNIHAKGIDRAYAAHCASVATDAKPGAPGRELPFAKARA